MKLEGNREGEQDEEGDVEGEVARYKSKWVIYFQSDLGSCEGCIVYLYWTILLRLACISCTRGLALILALMFLQIVYFR